MIKIKVNDILLGIEILVLIAFLWILFKNNPIDLLGTFAVLFAIGLNLLERGSNPVLELFREKGAEK